MKARLIKPRKLEQQKETIFELMNGITGNNSRKPVYPMNTSMVNAANNSNSNMHLKLGIALLTGGVLQQYRSR